MRHLNQPLGSQCTRPRAGSMMRLRHPHSSRRWLRLPDREEPPHAGVNPAQPALLSGWAGSFLLNGGGYNERY